jgi:protein-S-isoprenylcysteine O-methyltransferase Ste14
VFAFLFEAFVAARFGRRAVGRKLTSDQRARFAITSTAVTLVLCGLGVLVASYLGPGPWLKQLVVRGLPVLMGVALACAAALALLRYLLVTLLSNSR